MDISVKRLGDRELTHGQTNREHSLYAYVCIDSKTELTSIWNVRIEQLCEFKVQFSH